MRWMSAVEYARLQGAPDYKFNVRRNQALTGFADAVCVPVIEWIDRHVLAPAATQQGYDMNLPEAETLIPYQLMLAENA